MSNISSFKEDDLEGGRSWKNWSSVQQAPREKQGVDGALRIALSFDCLVEAGSFPKRKWRASGSGGDGVLGRARRNGRKGKYLGCSVWEKNSFSIKKNWSSLFSY